MVSATPADDVRGLRMLRAENWIGCTRQGTVKLADS
jgi:hypothetical protein